MLKKFYEGLLNHAYALVVVLCGSVYAPPWVQNNYGNEIAVIFCFAILVTSIIIFAFTFWWVKSSWLSFQPARMAMLCFSSVLGMMISISALTGIYGILPTSIYMLWRDLPATILSGLVLVFAFIDLAFFSKRKKVD